jgi:hypothetical protein
MARQPNGEPKVIGGFDYPLAGDSADKVRPSAERIGRLVQQVVKALLVAGAFELVVRRSGGYRVPVITSRN